MVKLSIDSIKTAISIAVYCWENAIEVSPILCLEGHHLTIDNKVHWNAASGCKVFNFQIPGYYIDCTQLTSLQEWLNTYIQAFHSKGKIHLLEKSEIVNIELNAENVFNLNLQVQENCA